MFTARVQSGLHGAQASSSTRHVGAVYFLWWQWRYAYGSSLAWLNQVQNALRLTLAAEQRAVRARVELWVRRLSRETQHRLESKTSVNCHGHQIHQTHLHIWLVLSTSNSMTCSCVFAKGDQYSKDSERAWKHSRYNLAQEHRHHVISPNESPIFVPWEAAQKATQHADTESGKWCCQPLFESDEPQLTLSPLAAVTGSPIVSMSSALAPIGINVYDPTAYGCDFHLVLVTQKVLRCQTVTNEGKISVVCFVKK